MCTQTQFGNPIWWLWHRTDQNGPVWSRDMEKWQNRDMVPFHKGPGVVLCWEMGWIDPLIQNLMTWLHRSQVTECCLVSGSITEVNWTELLLKENETGDFWAGISECLSVCKDFLQYCTLSNEYILLIIRFVVCAHQHSHIPTTTQGAYFHGQL